MFRNRQSVWAAAAAQVITVHIGGHLCAIELTEVVNVLPYAPATRYPGALPPLHGLIEFNGRPTPVIDFGRMMGLPPATVTKWTCVVYLISTIGGEDGRFGLMVDSVDGVLDYDAIHEGGEREEIPERYVRGCVRDGSRAIPILATQTIRLGAG